MAGLTPEICVVWRFGSFTAPALRPASSETDRMAESGSTTFRSMSGCDSGLMTRTGRVPPRETCGFGRRFHSGGKPDALDRPAGKAFQSFQAQRQVRATFGARDGVHFIHDNGINGGKYPSRLGSEQQEQRFWRGYEDIRRMADDSAPFLRRGVAASYAHADFRRWQSHRLALSGDAVQWSLQVFRDIRAQRLQGETYSTLTPSAGLPLWSHMIGLAGVLSGHQPVDCGKERAQRYPEPVGATTRTFSPAWMAGQACRCASADGRTHASNHVLVAWKTSPNIRTYVRLWHRLQTCQPSIGAINPFRAHRRADSQARSISRQAWRKRIALARPFFSTDTLAGVMPIASAKLIHPILRLASITSRFTRIAMSITADSSSRFVRWPAAAASASPA